VKYRIKSKLSLKKKILTDISGRGQDFCDAGRPHCGGWLTPTAIEQKWIL
jgi:hypothetical protein